jgi:gas vesicle protein
VGALLFSGVAVNHTLDSVLAILGLGLTAVGILLPVIYSFRNEVKEDTAALRKEVKEDTAALRKEIKEDTAALRKEIKEDTAALLKEVKDDTAALRKEVKEDTAALRKEVEEVGKKIVEAIDRLVEWRFEDRELVVTKMAEVETRHNGQIVQVHARIDYIASNVLGGSLSNGSRNPSTSRPVELEDPPAANA